MCASADHSRRTVSLGAYCPTHWQSRTGCKFLTGQGVQEGAAPLCRKDFSYRYCRLKTIIQWCIAKNRGGYTLEMRRRRCRAASAEGARIEAPKAPRGWGSWGEDVPLPSRLGGLGERRQLPQRGPGRSPGRQRILGIFQRLRSFL